MENKAGRASPILLVKIIVVLLILNFVIIFQDLYSCFHYIIKALLHILSNIVIVRKMWIIKSPKLQPGAGSSSCLRKSVEGERHEKLNVEEVKLVMEKATLNSSEITMLFEDELSVEEVKEAFGIFDENRDGFIDAVELRNVLSTLNLSQASVVECEKMIQAFDEDGDGRIDFNEFVKLLDYGFSWST